MAVLTSILPIFLVIGLGIAGARRGWFPAQFIEPANRLAYNLAIPALIFRAVAKAPLSEALHPLPMLLALLGVTLGWLLAVAAGRLALGAAKGREPTRASFIQGAIHGNQAYIGLAVVYYALGQAGLNAAALVVAVIIIMQNLLAVLTLHHWGGGATQGSSPVKAVLMSPIIGASALGLAYSLSGLPLPRVLDQTLNILAGLGLPLALLIIGAKLSQGRLGGNRRLLALIALLKLLVMPAVGWGLFWLAGQGGLPMQVTVILLASPTATISVIMAGHLGGDVTLASENVTLTHALSALTYSLWLVLLHA
ncbi:MAG: AEC family transporter [Desulfarculus sp.]|nr:AEC family transporter [Desulfarculus sp.]